MKRIILVILLIYSGVFSAQRTICKGADPESPCDDSTLYWAAAYGSNGDTLVQITDTNFCPGRAGYDDYMRPLQLYKKDPSSEGIYCISDGTVYTFYFNTTGDSVRIDGIKFIFANTYVASMYLIRSVGHYGFNWSNLVFDYNDNTSNTGIRLQASLAITVTPSYFTNIWTNMSFPRYDGDDVLRMCNFNRCWWDSANGSFGKLSVVDSSYLSTTGEYALFGDSITISNSTFYGYRNATPEIVTTDDAARTTNVKDYSLSNLVMHDCRHVAIACDGWFYSTLEYINIGPDTTALLYNHGSAAKDTIDSLIIKNVTATNNGTFLTCAGASNTHNKIKFDRVYMVTTYGSVTDAAIELTGTNHTVQYVYSNKDLTITGVGSVSDTISNIAAGSVLIDSLRYRFLKQNVETNQLIISSANNLPTDWVGMYGYLINHNGVPTDTTETSYTITDSISTEYWYLYGPAYPCSLIVTLWDSIGGSWSAMDTDTVVAGEIYSLTASGLSASEEHFYRSIGTPIGQASGQFVDTTKIFSITTEGGVACDTIGGVHNVDSATTWVVVACTLQCARDTVTLYYTADTAGVVDSLRRYTGALSPADEVLDTITGLFASDSTWYWYRDNTFETVKYLIHTKDSVGDSLPVDFCAAPSIDSLVNNDGTLDSGTVGDTITTYGSDFKSSGASAFLSATECTIIDSSDTQVVWTVPSIAAGTYNHYLTDSCGNYSDTVQFVVVPPPQCTLSISSSNASYGSVSPSDTVVDSGTVATIAFTITASGQLDSIQIASGTVDTVLNATGDTLTVTAHSNAEIVGYFSLNPEYVVPSGKRYGWQSAWRRFVRWSGYR